MPTPHAEPRPVDLITLKAAATLAGRSIDTVRRWRTEHGLRDYRDPADPSAPSAFSRAELLALLTRLASTRAARAGSDVVDAVLEPTGAVVPMPARPPVAGAALVHVLVDDLRTHRDRLQADVDRLSAELTAERARAAAALEQRDEAQRRAVSLAERVGRLEGLIVGGKAKPLEAERKRLRKGSAG